MPTYAIGDVQGCFNELLALLSLIHFDPNQDTLWFTGDLINRGTQSLEALRYIRALPERTVCVLGNHDLALLAAASGAITPKEGDTYQAILTANDKDDLLEWLRHRPLFHQDPQRQFILSHAGIYPLWSAAKAQNLAKEAEALLQGPEYHEAMHSMFGDLPNKWSDSLTGWDRFRFIVNAFTRMRFCDAHGTLDLGNKGGKTHHHAFLPWFNVPSRQTQQNKLLFGHWAALEGKTDTPRVYALDTGCVWGNALTAFCLETEQRYQVSCRPQAPK
ncbi:MAG: symmetrical bis(5'-nucleosyl)-tetraphosphatase [Candidatus Berkiella sp.]